MCWSRVKTRPASAWSLRACGRSSTGKDVAALRVVEGDSVTHQYLAESGEVTMTRVTSREAYGTFSFEAMGGDREREGLQVTVSGDFRGYH